MKNSGKMLLILIPVALVVVGGVAFVLLRGRHHSKPPEKEYALALNELTVNLADKDRPHHLGASVTLQIKGLDPEKSAPECEAQIRDAVLMVMSQHKYDELLSTEGKQGLKDAIAIAVSKVIANHKLRVADVLFTAFLMD